MKRESLELFDASNQAASSIQSMARMRTGVKRFDDEVSWSTFNKLDANEEAQQMIRQSHLQKTELGAYLSRTRPPASDLDAWEKKAVSNSDPVDSSRFATLTFPLTETGIMNMMAAFKSGLSLHYNHAIRLVAEYRRWATTQPTLVEISVAPGERLTVCGDIHGQLQDLFTIYSLNGVPSRKNRYLMNGDFVDRGQNSCEVLFTLLSWVLLYPPGSGVGPGVALNRGNHETHSQNVTNGFMQEVLAKYGTGPSVCGDSALDRGIQLYDSIQAAFECAPLATVISDGTKRVFVVHGGLLHRPGVTLAHIAAINRKREIPYGHPGFEDRLFEDLMWSDPRIISETAPSDRGAGVFFGADVTERFCALNNVALVVRSHECVPDGYQYMHDDRLVTVFSASKYCGRSTNKGAFLLFNSELQYIVRNYSAPLLSSTNPSLIPPSTVNVELANRYFANVLDDNSFDFPGTAVSTHDHSAPAAALSPIDSLSHSADVSAAIDDDASSAQSSSNTSILLERICMHKPDLYFFYSAADRGGTQDGCITKQVWADGMRTVLDIDIPFINLCSTLCDIESDGRINFTRFLDRYHIAMRDSEPSWMQAVVNKVCESTLTLEETFRAWDEDGNGVIEVSELEKGLVKANVDLSKSQIYDLMNSIDKDRDGRIQLSEFIDRFKVQKSPLNVSEFSLADATGSTSTSSSSWQRSIIDRIVACIFMYRYELEAAFKMFDTDGNGKISKQEFRVGLAALTSLSGTPLTESQADMLLSKLDANGDGEIDYAEFCTAFRVVDNNKEL
jgi:Ca2+-binding EF-hand superfamily protein/diadenosine tetraphosphatase ApaH/serine/threonine PP2A family protein phosphatase